jgi:hypothetical protein
MAERDIEFRAVLIDDTAAGQAKVRQQAVQTAKQMGTAAEEAGKKSALAGGLVSDKLGKAMSQTNERTEKARQMLMLFGSAAGNAAGQAVYFGGTILYIVGQFRLWQLAGMGAVAAVVALGAAIHQMVNGPVIKANEEIKKQIDQTRALNKEFEKFAERQLDARHGTTEFEKQIRRARMAERDLTKEVQDLRKSLGGEGGIAKAEELLLIGMLGSDAETGLKRLHEARLELALTKSHIIDMANIAQSEAMAKLRDALGLGGRLEQTTQEVFLSFVPKVTKGKGKGGKSAFEIGKEYGKEIAAGIIKEFEAEQRILDQIGKIIAGDEKERAHLRAQAQQDELTALAERNRAYLEVVKTGEEAATAIYQENANRREVIWANMREAQIEAEKRAQEDRLTYIESSISATEKMGSIVGDVADAIGMSSKKQMQIQAAFQAITDTLNAAHCFATAAEYFAAPFGSGTAQGVAYSVAGAMYVASAALAAAKAGGAFGGGGGGGGGGARGGGGYSGGQSDRYRGGRGPDRDQWERGAQQTVIWQVSGSMFFGQDAAREITQLQEGYDSRQNPGRSESSF